MQATVTVENAARDPYDKEWRRTLGDVARAVLGGFIDGCLVHVLDLDATWQCEGAFVGATGAEHMVRLARLPAGLPAYLGEVAAAASPRLVKLVKLIKDVDGADEFPARLLQALDAHSLVAVPARVEGRVVAVLTFLRCARRQDFQRDDLAPAEALAATAAIAIGNAETYAHERRAHLEYALQQRDARLAVEAPGNGAGDLVGPGHERNPADRALAAAEAASLHSAARMHQQLESIIDTVPFPISYIDASGRYAYVSRGYELWFGQPRAWFVGELVSEHVGPDAYERLRPMIEGALSGERQQFELTLPYARGGTREVAASYLPQFDEGGRPSGFVAVIVDVSEHKALIESLRRSLRFSEEFVGILGHDLRSPLAAISMTSAVLLRRLGTNWAAEPVLRIERSAERMARMIDQILDFTQARLGGGIPVRPAPMDLAALVQEIVIEVGSAASQPIEVELEGAMHGQWDPDRLGQLLSNLLANAVEHGCRHTPVRLLVRGSEPDTVLLTVWNTGVIPKSVLPVVFDRFQRGNAESGYRSQGLGLGLYIVQQIVLAHGGTIEVRSSEEEGTCFSVLLPRGASAPPPPAGPGGA